MVPIGTSTNNLKNLTFNPHNLKTIIFNIFITWFGADILLENLLLQLEVLSDCSLGYLAQMKLYTPLCNFI